MDFAIRKLQRERGRTSTRSAGNLGQRFHSHLDQPLQFLFAHHLTRPLLPLYLVSFGASSTVVGAVIGVFTITSTIMRVPVGLYIDRLGRKPFLFYGIVLLTAANFGYLWAPSILLIIPCRILHGMGWSGCSTAISTLAADIAPRQRRGELIGYAGMASSLAGSLGPVAGF